MNGDFGGKLLLAFGGGHRLQDIDTLPSPPRLDTVAPTSLNRRMVGDKSPYHSLTAVKTCNRLFSSVDPLAL